MNNHIYEAFLNSDDTIRVYANDELIFSSKKKGLLALLDYIHRFSSRSQRVIILDKVTGNAAALLSIKASGKEVYSPLGSQLAVETLDKYGIRHHLNVIVPYILKSSGEEMCPMEKLSIGKNPDEFLAVIEAIVNK